VALINLKVGDGACDAACAEIQAALETAGSKGAIASGQMMPASSWLASMVAATSRLGPMP
jgi:hypothetical protein